ncbi:hypothetical protein L3Q82_018525 [Scortum barcoo]|uniref:Uncharacterized protein n=1 Tax=Scortum barcoo TaxID=214431 RepID=A0ACB8VGB1_9TELE|nr:hypothetical protein L3Q82_018525 [Scortum barcoo]
MRAQIHLPEMQFCGCLLFSCLLSITLLHCSIDGFRVQQQAGGRRTGSQELLAVRVMIFSTHPHLLVFQHVVRPGWRSRPGGVKAGEELTAKLLRLDDLVRMENDIMEPKRKRSFPGNNAPMDRLSISSMETKQGTNKQSKVVESARRRVNPPPIDRIGMSRLPNSRG